MPDPDLASQSTWHPIKQLRALISLFEEFPVPVADTQSRASYKSGEPHKERGLSPAALGGSTRGHKAGLGAARAGFCSLCQNLLSMEYIPQHHSDTGTCPSSAKAPWQLLLAPLSDNSATIATGMFSLCLLWAVVSSQSPALSLLSLMRKALCSSFPQFSARMIFSQPPLFSSIFKPVRVVTPTSD